MSARNLPPLLVSLLIGIAACEHAALEPHSTDSSATPLWLDTIRVSTPVDPPLTPSPQVVTTWGTVTEAPSRGGSAAFLIEEKPDEPAGPAASPLTSGDKYHVYVDAETSVHRRVGPGDIRPATVDDVKVGSLAEVWFRGPIRESYPAQGTAGRILIVEWVPEEQ